MMGIVYFLNTIPQDQLVILFFMRTSILIDFDKNIGIVLFNNRIHLSCENVRLLAF